MVAGSSLLKIGGYMETLYKAKFLGQGFSIPFGTIVDIIAERKDLRTVLLAKNEKLLYIVSQEKIEKIK